MAVKRRYIVVPKGSVESICKELGVHRACVYNALNYITNSDNARQIRHLALTVYGGVTATKVIW